MNTGTKPSWFTFYSKPLVLVIAVFLLGTAVFLPTLGYDFVWDDFVQIKENPQIKSLAGVPQHLFSKVPITQFSQFYRPLYMISFSLDYAFFQENPWGYHLTNSLIHGLNSSLVAYLALLLLQNPYGALIAGALFALHPAHVEAVAFIAGRVDLLPTFFSLLTLIVIARKTNKSKGLGPLLWAPIFFFLALLSKENAITVLIPAAILFYQKQEEEETVAEPVKAAKKKRKQQKDRRQNQERTKKWKAVMLRILPLLLVLGLYLALRFKVLQSLTLEKMRLFHSPYSLFDFFVRYLSFLVFPFQRVSYINDVFNPFASGGRFWALAGVTFLFLAGMGYILYHHKKTWFFFALIITPCLPPLYYSLYTDAVMVERYLYLPSAGLALLVVWALLRLPPEAKVWARTGIVVLLAVYLGMTLWRMPLWKEETVLFTAMKEKYPSSPFIRRCLGMFLIKQNKYSEAYQELSEAVNLDPNNPYNHTFLGWALLYMAQTQKAREEFLAALKVMPKNSKALEGMGLTYVQEGNKEKALEYLDWALLADPQNQSALVYKEGLLSIKSLKVELKPIKRP